MSMVTLGLTAAPAGARQPGAAAGDFAACGEAIASAEAVAHVPDRLMVSIGVVESGRRFPSRQDIVSWPWSVNIDGQTHFFESKAEALAAVRAAQQAGARSIDVGCMQINLQSHPDAFATLEAAFDPVTNATYAARFLTRLFAQLGTWSRAVAAYHSREVEAGQAYLDKVTAVLPPSTRGTWPMSTDPAPVGSPFTPQYADEMREAQMDSSHLELARLSASRALRGTTLSLQSRSTGRLP